MNRSGEFETVIIGGGQAGLSVSYYLKNNGRNHIVLEKSSYAANAWRNHRWDSFTLNTPNWQNRLPGTGISGKDPDGFLRRDELVSLFDEYVRKNRIPIWYGAHVYSVIPSGNGYKVETTAGTFRAKNVVVATGLYQKPRIPRFNGRLSPDIRQIHSDSYRNPDQLPPGAVLVVGSAQSGAQIAEELNQSGRKVYLSVSRAGRVPRRYRGKDINWWNHTLGLYERTVDQLKSAQEKFAGKPHVSGAKGGHTLSLHQFATDGVTLLGRVTELDGTRVRLARNLHKNLAAADLFEANLVGMIDNLIEKHRMNAPPEMLPQLRAGFEQPERDDFDLAEAGVGSIIWATGYSFDFSMVRLPVLDPDGFPIQRRGVTGYPGLYFLGMPWMHNAKSGLLFGISEEAVHVASHILNREESREPASNTFASLEVSYEI